MVAGKVSGTVRIRLKNGKFSTLGANESIPLGSTVDATKGRVRLTSAAGGGKTQTADFYKGQFKITQTKGKKPITQLELNAHAELRRQGVSGGQEEEEGPQPVGRRQGALPHQGPPRGGDRARHQVVHPGHVHSTKITVKRGVVQVRDFVKRKNVTVKKGHSYVARKKKRK